MEWNQISKTNSLQGEINIFSNKPYHMDELMFPTFIEWIYEGEIRVKTHYRWSQNHCHIVLSFNGPIFEF